MRHRASPDSRRPKPDPGDCRKSPGSSLVNRSRNRNIALRCNGDWRTALAVLARMRQPVDVWLHPRRNGMRPEFERHPKVRRVYFSPVRDTRTTGGGVNSQIPVYGPYDDVLDT